MIDHKSIFLWLASNSITILGLITVNSIAIGIGCIAGLTTIGWNVLNMYYKIKENKKNGDRLEK